MKLVSTVLAWAGRTLVNIIGGLILLTMAVAIAVGLTTQSPIKGLEAGAKVGFALVHYGTVASGIVLSYGDDVGPGFKAGQDLGNQQAAAGGI